MQVALSAGPPTHFGLGKFGDSWAFTPLSQNERIDISCIMAVHALTDTQELNIGWDRSELAIIICVYVLGK